MATICYGWGDILKKRTIMGYQFCESCNKVTPVYLSRRLFRVHISYIPIFMWPKGYAINCKKCKRYLDIPKEEYKKLTDDFKPMKKLAKQCYKEVTRLCQNITVQSEESVNSVYMQIASQYPIASNENLKGQWKRAISDTIAYTIAFNQAKAEAEAQKLAKKQKA